MAASSRLLEFRDFIIKLLPRATEYVGSRDYYVDLIRSRFHGSTYLGHAFLHWRQAGRESRGDGGHANAAPLERSHRCFHEAMIDTNRRHLDVKFFDLEMLYKPTLDRLPCFGTKPAHSLVGIGARKRCQIHARDRPQKPCGLPLFLHRSPGHVRLRSALNRACVYSDLLHPVKIQRDAAVGE